MKKLVNSEMSKIEGGGPVADLCAGFAVGYAGAKLLGAVLFPIGLKAGLALATVCLAAHAFDA